MSEDSISIQWLNKPTEEQIQRVIEILTTAFEPDVELNNSLFHGDKSLLPIKVEANVRAGVIGGRIQVASRGLEVADIVGAAVWFPPGAELNGTEEQRNGGGSTFLDTSPEELRNWWLEYLLPVVFTLEKEHLGPGFKAAQWSLLMFAVQPEFQHQGIGKEMLRNAEELVRRDKVSIELETFTPLDVVIYKRMGFTIACQADIETPVGTHTLYQMVKVP